MDTKQNIQKTLYSLNNLENDMKQLKLINEHPPCICLSGLRSLYLTQMVKNGDFVNIIQTLFKLLKIPAEWILEIKTPPYTSIEKNKIPFEVFIFLIDNHLKLKVYKLLLNHLKHSKQSKIHLRLVN
jgi:hypothetical protein